MGIDGSGKTTQAHRIAELLAAAGIPAAYRRNAGGRHWFGRLAQRIGVRDGERLLGDGGMMVVELGLRWLAMARARVLTFVHRDVSVMDRYAVCQYASIRAHGGRRAAERLARVAYGVFPAPDVTFLLAVEPGTAYQRIEVRGTDHESLEFLAGAAAAYRGLPEHDTFVTVDAGGTPDSVTAAIRAHLAGDPALPRLTPVVVPAPLAPRVRVGRRARDAAQARP